MSVLNDHTGKQFGHWIVIKRATTSPHGDARWFCKCICGKEKTLYGFHLKSGGTKSCGCLRYEANGGHGATRNKKETVEYRTWKNVIARCYNPKRKGFKYYGGRGIKVCDKWLNNYKYFLADMGLKPSSEYSIERIDVNGNYEPSNCKWATKVEQNRNKRNNRTYTFNGKTMVMQDWAKYLGISPSQMSIRLADWPIEKALGLKKCW
jgi:hypothetical protein